MRTTTRKPKTNRYRKPGSLAQLKAIVWDVLLEVEVIAKTGADSAEKLRAAHCLATLAGVYVKALETSNLESRLDVLELALEGENLRVVTA